MSFTVSELFTLSACLFGNYLHFAAVSIAYNPHRQHLAGHNEFNCLVFSPWIWMALALICMAATQFVPSLWLQATICLLTATLGTVLIEGQAVSAIDFELFLADIFHPTNYGLFKWFLSSLLVFLPIFHTIKRFKISKLTIRKCFHALALILFVPPIYYASQGKPQASRFVVFAFNCAAVLLVGLELLRAVPLVKPVQN